MSKKRIKPLGEYVLIGATENQEPSRTKSGLVMPPLNNANKNSGNLCRGKILDLPKSDEAKSKSLAALSIGQIVLYPDWAGHLIDEVSGANLEDSEYNGLDCKKVVLVKAEEIKAIVEGTNV